MLTRVLAAHPHTPAQIRRVLVERARRGTPGDYQALVLACALARNTAIPTSTVATLYDEVAPTSRYEIVQAALWRPRFSSRDAIDLLTPQVGADALNLVAMTVPDPDGQLTEHILTLLDTLAATDPTDGIGVWATITTRPTTRTEHARTAASHLAAHATSSHADQVLRTHAMQVLDHATTPAEHAAAVAHVRALAHTVSSPDLARVLTDRAARHPGPRTPAPGTLAWLTHPATSTRAVLTWLTGEADTHDWIRALTHHPDPTGDLARAALDTYPHHFPVLEQLLSQHRPVHVRQRAFLAAHDPRHPGGAIATGVPTADILDAGDPTLGVQAATRLIRRLGREVLVHVAERLDLTPAHLDDLLRALPGPEHDFAICVLTHPAARPDQRAAAVTLLHHTAQDFTFDQAHTAAVADLSADLVDLDPADPHQATRIAARIHVANHLPPMGSYPPFNALVAGTIARLLPNPTPQEAEVLVRLADTFTGTLAELVDTARTITT